MSKQHIVLAIVLSLLVIVGWQYVVGYRQMERQRLEAELKQQQQHAQAQTSTSQSSAPSAQAQAASREAVIDSSPRVPINTSRLAGSINLKGGRIDDLTLTQYRETIDPASPSLPEKGRSTAVACETTSGSSMITRDEARRIAANIKLPHLYFAPMTIAQ